MKCLCDMPQWKNVGVLALRIAVGVVFLYAGINKLSDIEATTGFFTSLNIPAPAFFAYFVGLIETLGGAMIIAGFQLKTASIVLAINMIFALLLAHTKMPFASAQLPIVLLGALMALHGVGGGSWRMSKKECACEMMKK